MTDLEIHEDLPEILAQAENLPSLPAVAVEVLHLTEDENSTLDDLAVALSRDPALAAKLLKLANSSLFNVGQEVTTLQRSTMVLGMKTVKLMSLSFSLVGTLPQGGVDGGFDFSEYWRRSLISAVTARSLAKLVGNRNGDEAFLCGLLGHIGRLVLARCMTDEYNSLIEEVGSWPSLEMEEARLGFDSADVGATLLATWGIPEIVCTAVGYRERIEQTPILPETSTREFLELMHLTSLAEAMLCNEEKGEALKRLHHRAQEQFQLSEVEVDAFLIGLESGITETAEVLSISLPKNTTHEELVNQARGQFVNISLGTEVDLRREKRRAQDLEHETKTLRVKAETDKLTGLPNRAVFDETLEMHIQSRLEGKVPRALGLIMIDIDRFKNFNDTYGHQAGDEVLRLVGGVMIRLTRSGDLCARYGGEEFAVIAPQTTPFGLRTLAERLREELESQILEIDGHELSITASFGAACIADIQSAADGPALIKLADHHLYRAKKNGRNRCEIHQLVRFPGR
jgi:two-component system, cell cycle response regulator